MCGTCGCGEEGTVSIRKPGEDTGEHTHSHSHAHDHQGHAHEHSHQHKHAHSHAHEGHQQHHESSHGHEHGGNGHHHRHEREIQLEIDVMQKNNLLAERNRGYFEAKQILALNLVSSPGSGKTSLLEKTIKDFKSQKKIYIIEGDQQTMNDADRIEKAGAPVVQVNTGSGCHLDADMINKAVKILEVEDHSLLFIENVGNLVCPSLFNLGEQKRVVIVSTTEGEDKPIKYPNMFQSSDVCIINKTDLLPYLDFDLEKMKEYALRVNHQLEFIEISVKNGEGLNKWYAWLKNLSL
ncbi:MAG: hydrogenase nickel incorporation protein HypB [Bacteroidales bacterium]|nr:hydrogenase nickel incorporation protein HypB [Bacteroidales bacterium]MCF8343104.1 hydrogenase nickel incorporation protein HypB [Bacteroidales bacterium]MCF8349631.1 hydrogenase nickel incorporation protein HypB [Bacteroidales bacterium]MCF8376072.1 hydrogenase nickel incorporation protein HypB [Bacteroidales bacterium]MCF8400395.1 hydrogenase nickel incorporation protein HypB [Bacteroidales bacterium]